MSENRRRLADHCRPKVRGLIVFIQMRFKLRIFSVDGPRMLIPPGISFYRLEKLDAGPTSRGIV